MIFLRVNKGREERRKEGEEKEEEKEEEEEEEGGRINTTLWIRLKSLVSIMLKAPQTKLLKMQTNILFEVTLIKRLFLLICCV